MGTIISQNIPYSATTLSQQSTPIGAIIPYMGTTAPSGYLACDGGVYSISLYPLLAGFFEAQFGSINYFGGDGTTTFAVPNLQGEFLRGAGTNSHANQGSGGSVGIHQDGTLIPRFGVPRNQNIVQVMANSGDSNGSYTNNADTLVKTSTGTLQWFSSTATSNATSATENALTSRPTNTSVLYIIKAKSDRLDKITFAEVDDDVVSDGSVFTSQGVKDFVGDCGYSYATARWLRFNPNDKKGLIIKAGTRITLKSGIIKVWATDTPVSFSGLSAGTDYFVFVDNSGNVTCSTSATPASNQVKIGRFHTLCTAVGTPTMIAPASPSSGLAAGGKYLVKSYDSGADSDFYNFYNKTITTVSTGSKYDIITMSHPLSGFTAGDILPESVFCLSFRPECTVEDAMCYDKDTGLAVDVYLQSGTGFNTRSAYNKTHTVSREQGNHQQDYRMVGKRLLRDAEFTSAALGSNEKTAIQGAADKGTVGGHVDTSGRRMISAIGIEEMCGYLWQWLDDFVGANQDNKWDTRDGQNGFGQEYWNQYVLLAGGDWGNSSCCGSRCRTSADVRSFVGAAISGRGSSRVYRG